MHVCTAYVSLGGDPGSVVVRGRDNPVTWPEIGLLQFIHGEENVYNVEVLEEIQRHRSAEKDRLKDLYGDGPVELVYPGRSPMMEMNMPATDAEYEQEDPDDISKEELEARIAAVTAKRRGRPKKHAGKVHGVLKLGDKDIPLTDETGEV